MMISFDEELKRGLKPTRIFLSYFAFSYQRAVLRRLRSKLPAAMRYLYYFLPWLIPSFDTFSLH
jgi:hypothetical protein